MSQTRRSFDTSFKLQAVRMIKDQGISVSRLASLPYVDYWMPAGQDIMPPDVGPEVKATVVGVSP